MSIWVYKTYRAKDEDFVFRKILELKAEIDAGVYQNKGLYEWIGNLGLDQMVRPYFDLDFDRKNDISKTFEQLLDPVIEWISGQFSVKKQQILYSTAHTDSKLSCHLIIPTLKVKLFKLIAWHKIVMNELKNLYLDPSVYRKKGTMRLVGTSKVGRRAPLKIIDGKFEDHLITFLKGDEEEWVPAIKEIKTTPKTTPTPEEGESKPQRKITEHERERVKALLSIINNNENTTWTEWNDMLLCLHNIDESLLEEWISWSHKSPKFKLEDTVKAWETYKPSLGPCLTMGTLHFLAKRDNPEQFASLCDKVNPQLTASNDSDAANIVLSKMKGEIFSCDGQVWVFLNSTRVFVSNRERVMGEIIYRVMQLRIQKMVKGYPVPYSTNLSGATSISKVIINIVENGPEWYNERFVDDMISFTKGKLFFQNGYIDLTTARVVDDTNDIIMTPIRIPRQLPNMEIDDSAIGKELFERVLLPIFGTEEVVNNYCQHLARAIGGHIEDKDWLILTGMRDCGKGVLEALNSGSFGPYCGTTSANNFLMEKMHTMEDAKKYSWLSDNRWVRLLHTSEVKLDPSNPVQIDGNLIKGKLASGGDKVEVRNLYQSAVRVQPQCRLLMMCNDVPPISPPDAVQTVSKFCFPSKFIERDVYEEKVKNGIVNPNTRPKDPHIKEFVAREDVREAFIMRIVAIYESHKVINCPKVKEDTYDINVDLGDELTIIKKYFTFTGSKEDYILSKDLTKFHKAHNLPMTIGKLKDLIKFNGGIHSTHLLENRGATGFLCVKMIEVEED